jgi:hypothetical protein
MPDPFAAIPELDDFDIYSGDGHYHSAACHDKKVEYSDGTKRGIPIGHFFQLDMRSHFLRHMEQAKPGDGKKAEHDIRAVKRAGAIALRSGAKKGRKVIYAWDRAIIDTNFWDMAKNTYGLYFITMDKEGMEIDEVDPREIDLDDYRNAGVIGDDVGYSRTSRRKIRRIIYVDPATGKSYTYLTTEMTLPPGVLVLIFKQRWDIEKVFDEVKTKLEEKKAWASSRTAKTIQANFLCVVHNLMLLLENDLETNEGVTNEKEILRRQSRKSEIEKNSESNGGASFVAIAVQRITQRSRSFIRWLRNHIYRDVPWEYAVARLRYAYAM